MNCISLFTYIFPLQSSIFTTREWKRIWTWSSDRARRRFVLIISVDLIYFISANYVALVCRMDEQILQNIVLAKINMRNIVSFIVQILLFKFLEKCTMNHNVLWQVGIINRRGTSVPVLHPLRARAPVYPLLGAFRPRHPRLLRRRLLLLL